MGCKCCKILKSDIYNPTVPVGALGHKRDPSTNSLVPPYQSHRLPDEVDYKKQGFQNFGYTSSTSPTKLDIDNNQINRLHANNQARSNLPQPTGGDSSLYILQPEEAIKTSSTYPSAPVLCTVSVLGAEPGKQAERFRDSGLGTGDGNDGSDGYLCGKEEDEEREHGERVSGTPEYVEDTADEESVISVDIHTSSTSLSSGDCKLVLEDREEEHPSLSRKNRVMDKEMEECVSVTDSMVAEALAALDAATAGEEYE